jgi:hypothetical protein
MLEDRLMEYGVFDIGCVLVLSLSVAVVAWHALSR